MHDLEPRLADMLQQLERALLFEDPDRQIIYVNQAFCDVFGFEGGPESVIGQACDDVRQKVAATFADPEGFADLACEMLSSPDALIGRCLETHDGRWLDLDHVLLRDGERYLGRAWKFRDVTEREQAMERVRTSKRSLQALLENTPVPLWSVDERLQLVDFNDAYRTLTEQRTGWGPVPGAPVPSPCAAP